MAVKIRLARAGAKKKPYYQIVVADERYKRDGRFIEMIGHYNPLTDPAEIKVDEERALYWLQVGAQASDTARMILKRSGVWDRFVEGKRK